MRVLQELRRNVRDDGSEMTYEVFSDFYFRVQRAAQRWRNDGHTGASFYMVSQHYAEVREPVAAEQEILSKEQGNGL